MTDLTVAPLDSGRWADLVTLFGPDRGAYGRCWCMFWRVTGRQFDNLGGDGRRSAFHDRVVAQDDGAPPAGLLAYDDQRPVGWIAIAPRTEFGRLDRSPLLKPVDDAPVWSITCLYVHPDRRRGGVTGRLIDAAVELAATHDAPAVEAYPIDTDGDADDSAIYTGTSDMFTHAGFIEIDRRRHRPVMRRQLLR